MGQGRKHKSKPGKAHEKARTEESQAARAGEADEPSTSQGPVHPFPDEASGDEDTASTRGSKTFTDAQDKQIAAFFGKHRCFYDKTHPDYKNRKKRDALLKQFAQSMFASGKCVLSFENILHTIVFLLLMKRVMKLQLWNEKE